jgi:hypothetical protein
MVAPWLAAGFICYTVDTQHPPGEHREGNLIRVGADILTWLPPRADHSIVFAFPPCTDLASSGAKHFRDKGLAALAGSLTLVNRCREICEWADAPYLLENPIGTLSTYWRPPDHTFSPCDYGGYLSPPGDAYTKRTCLWTGGGFVMPQPLPVAPEGNRKGQPNAWYSKVGGKSVATKNYRSQTPEGFALAVFLANTGFRPCEFCGYRFDGGNVGRFGCPNCEGVPC